MMYLKQCLSYFKSYSFNYSLPICTLWNKFCICFSCTLVHVYVFQRYICSWYWEIYTSRCLSPIAKNLELSLYYSWYVFGFLAIKSSWIFLNLELLQSCANPSISYEKSLIPIIEVGCNVLTSVAIYPALRLGWYSCPIKWAWQKYMGNNIPSFYVDIHDYVSMP